MAAEFTVVELSEESRLRAVFLWKCDVRAETSPFVRISAHRAADLPQS
jgi:hypothetical protein